MQRYKSFSFGDLPDFADQNDYYEGYEHLFDMVEKKHICSLTEPEDRTFFRDLDKLIKLLNELSATTHNSDYAKCKSIGCQFYNETMELNCAANEGLCEKCIKNQQEYQK